MNHALMNALGFKKEVDNVKAHKCPFCNKEINISEFRDECSLREYRISGLCQVCQDDVFNNDNDESDIEE